METDADKRRSDFLIEMYKQMMNDINRHIVVVWQSVTVLIGAFAVWSLVEKNLISLDVAVSLIIGISAWVLGHVYDASYWYNRNLVIIANIERQFLRQQDLRDIHHYFGAHRRTNAMITHLRLQRLLALGIAALVYSIHTAKVTWPAMSSDKHLDPENYLPSAAVIISAFFWGHSIRRGTLRYESFIKNSPGREIDTAGIEFGDGHPTDKK